MIKMWYEIFKASESLGCPVETAHTIHIPPIGGFPIDDEPPMPNADNYMKDPEYLFELIIKKKHILVVQMI